MATMLRGGGLGAMLRQLIVASALAAFLLSNGVLDLLGWPFTEEQASAIFKIHPVTYVLGGLAVIAALSFAERRLFLLPASFYFYTAVVGACLFMITLLQYVRQSSGGEQSGVIVTWLTPVLVPLSLMGLEERDKRRLGLGLQWVFAVNSLIAILEQLAGHRFVPTFLDADSHEWRSGGRIGARATAPPFASFSRRVSGISIMPPACRGQMAQRSSK